MNSPENHYPEVFYNPDLLVSGKDAFMGIECVFANLASLSDKTDIHFVADGKAMNPVYYSGRKLHAGERVVIKIEVSHTLDTPKTDDGTLPTSIDGESIGEEGQRMETTHTLVGVKQTLETHYFNHDRK